MTAGTLEHLNAALAGRYVVERPVGSGGMAVVWRAHDVRHRRPVALKVLRPELAATIGAERFHREIELAARLQHPMVVPVFDSGEIGDLLYYVMPLVEGTSLRERLAADGPLPLADAAAIIRDVAGALEYAHRHGIIHRDVKPENILLTAGRAVVTDFGIARALGALARDVPLTPAHGTAITGQGFVIGTPAYMAPEQAMGGVEVDGRADLYALASVCYEMLTGRSAFTGQSQQAILAQSVAGPRPRLSRQRPDLPMPLDQLLVRALSVEPEDRPASVAAFAEEFERIVASATPVPVLPGVSDVPGAARRRTWRIAAVAAAATIGIVAYLQGRRADAPPVAPGAQVIAVMPFQITVPGLEELREGMVDLLARNLNDQGGIRTVDPPQVFARWKSSDHVPDRAAALKLARELRAGSALTGSVVAAGSTVRVSAELHGTDGSELARVQVEGAADSVLALVDALTLQLLREVWRSREPLPSVRVAALTTPSLGAMREYLRGEAFYRRSQFDSADAAYARALEQDSVFALALFRRTLVAGWTGAAYGSPALREQADVLARAAARLLPRERLLLTGFRLFDEGSLAAIDTARSYLARWPDDPEGWYLLGEAQYHTRAVNALSPAELRAPFDRVLQLDSTLAPAALHPVELALQQRDSIAFRRYVRLFRAAGAVELAENTPRVYGAVWGPQRGSAGDSAMAAALRVNNGLVSAIIGRLRDRDVDPDALLARLAGAERVVPDTPKPMRTMLAVSRVALATTLGRLREADRALDALRPVDVRTTVRFAAQRALLGLDAPAGADAVLRLVERRADDPVLLSWAATAAIARGELARARTVLAAAERLDTSRATLRPEWRAIVDAQRGWLQLAEGDTTGGLARMQAALGHAGGATVRMSAPLRYVQALALAARPETREEGIRRLRWGFEQDPDFLPVAFEALGRALEAKGDATGALDAYGQFARLWAGADPRLQPRVASVRRAMSDLAAEPRSFPPT
jgi:serine/threonine-protein kinase